MPVSLGPFLRFGGSDESVERPRLYCFAYAGGSSPVFASWARALMPRMAVLGVELPGHGTRFGEAPLESVEEMAAEAAEAIEAEGSDAPFALYGHSLGAVAAFETALRLEASARETGVPCGLIHMHAGAARAPHLPAVLPAISHLPRNEFLDAVQQRYGGLPAALFEEPELLEMVLPILRADFKAYERYRYAGPARLQCPITAYCGAKDPVVQSDAVGAWSQCGGGAFQLQTLDGGHFFLNECRDELLEKIVESFSGPVQALRVPLSMS